MLPKNLLIAILLVVGTAALFVVIWPYAFTVVPIQVIEEARLSEAFDPVAFVDSIWESQVLPSVIDNASDLALVLGQIPVDERGFADKEELAEVASEYGLTTVGEAHVFRILARGAVLEVDTTSGTGKMTVQLDGYNGPVKVTLFIGPRIPSDETSLRDGVGFIQFGDFKEQTEYGKVAREMNNRVNVDVLEALDKTALQGKSISFYGVFSVRTFNLTEIDIKQINIVPVRIEINE